MTGNHGFHALDGAGPRTFVRTSSTNSATCAAAKPAMSRKCSTTLPSSPSASRGFASVNCPRTTIAPPAGGVDGATGPPGRTQLTAYPFSSRTRSNSPRSAAGSSWLPAPSYRATRRGGKAEGFTGISFLIVVQASRLRGSVFGGTGILAWGGTDIPVGHRTGERRHSCLPSRPECLSLPEQPKVPALRGRRFHRRPVDRLPIDQRLHDLLGR